MDWDSIHHEGILYVSRKQSPVAFLKQLGIFVGIPTKPNLFWLETTWKVWKITGCRIENITQKHHVGKTKKTYRFTTMIESVCSFVDPMIRTVF